MPFRRMFPHGADEFRRNSLGAAGTMERRPHAETPAAAQTVQFTASIATQIAVRQRKNIEPAIGSSHQKGISMISFRRTALAAAVSAAGLLSLNVVQAAGIDEFQSKVNAIAAQHGTQAPDVRKELTAQVKTQNEEKNREAELTNALKKVSPIERVVAIDAKTIRAIQSQDGRIMYLVDNGRFAFVGKMFDIWNRKELSTIEEIAQAVNHIDLKRMGFKLDKVNHVSLGSGAKHVTIFVDPQCGWCHKLLAEIDAEPAYLKEYTFDFVIVPMLGERSTALSKKLWCAKTDDQKIKFNALLKGARTIEALEQKESCDTKVFDDTRLISQAVGVQAVPMLIAHDGRFERGKPRSLDAFLKGEAQPEKAPAAPKKTHVDLKAVGFDLSKLNHVSVGTGEKHVTAFVDPQCSWCHKLMAEIQNDPELMKAFTFDFVVISVLGDRSTALAEKFLCADETDQLKKFKALSIGGSAIDAMKAKASCDKSALAASEDMKKKIGIEGVPFVIAPDGRSVPGKPRDLRAFLGVKRTADAGK